MKRVLLVGVLCLLVACASSGVKVTQEKVESLQKGKTTYAEVIRDFGNPTSSTVSANGTKIVSYSYFGYQTRPETFIPFVGAFVGGADTEHSMVMLTFDDRGILKDYTATQGGSGVGRNLEGFSQDRKEVRQVQ